MMKRVYRYQFKTYIDYAKARRALRVENKERIRRMEKRYANF